MASFKTLNSVDLAGKRVLVRVDFNVPLDGDTITDNTRITAALPTIRHILEQKGKVILMSHLGRPKGQPNPKYSLRPVATELAKLLERPVGFVSDCAGPEAAAAVSALGEGGVLLLENVRFHAGEEKNDPELAARLAALGDLYVNDAFGSAHRAHASTAGVTEKLRPAVAGFLMEKELKFLGEETAHPKRPFVVILGGAKVSDKINVINRLLEKADTILIGGAMAYTFALAKGGKIGDSLSEPDKVEVAKAALEKAEKRGVKFLLPVDNQITDKLDFDNLAVGELKTVAAADGIPDGWEGVDIGPETIQLFSKEVAGAATILWNGPMGIFEIKACSEGTFAIAEAVAANPNAVSIIGGGDSVKAVNRAGVADKVSFISTGGGASLEFLEGKELPGVTALDPA
ncbi:MAG: phosphoglycerate kinase [Puniceicoccaceae bacterium]|nr:MAG: phosphoglycerate kinase [Puniceicoccaceae bacterium]